MAEPLTPEEETLYRAALRDAPTVAGLVPERTSLALITIAEWADRCRRLLATLDEARPSLDVKRLIDAQNAHWKWMEYRLHVCAGQGCADNISAEYACLGHEPVVPTARR